MGMQNDLIDVHDRIDVRSAYHAVTRRTSESISSALAYPATLNPCWNRRLLELGEADRSRSSNPMQWSGRVNLQRLLERSDSAKNKGCLTRGKSGRSVQISQWESFRRQKKLRKVVDIFGDGNSNERLNIDGVGQA